MNEELKCDTYFTIKDLEGNDLIVPIHNTTLTLGVNWVANRYKDNTYSGISHIAVGTGTNPTTVGMTALQTELTRKAATVSVLNNTITVTVVFNTGEAIGTLTEAGIYVNGGVILYDRVLFEFIKTTGISCVAQFTITLN